MTDRAHGPAALAQTVALVMAGGGGDRMRRSGVDLPKPLVPVAGRPLLDHNITALLHWGLRDIVVSVPAGLPAVGAACRDRLAPAVARAGGRLEVVVETTPLGNVGCAARLAGRAERVLVTFADNLTVLDIGELVAHHDAAGADLTLASHEHPFAIPYGRLALDGDRVTGYDEKPVLAVTVASAVSVLGPLALAEIPADRPTGLVDLTRSLLARGRSVVAHRHGADWIDVNDAGCLDAAAALVGGHRWLFPDTTW